MPPSSVCGEGRRIFTSPPSPRSTALALTKYSKEKLISFLYHFPPTLPHSSIIRLWRRAGESSHQHHHQDPQLRPSQNIRNKKNYIIPLRFPSYPPSFLHHPFVA
ncbi:hypothetical protein TNCV_1203231 [Trichonephila clavipes]|nr:hypothetical protein TNCV_1203231 [Trichonephila clavipes]